jgi:arylsulfatase A-like enzyme
MISALDDGVGRVLAKLRAHRLEETTLVVFLSDNGGPIGDRGNGSSNQPLRAGKGTTYEGGIRVPYALRWTGTLPAGALYEHPVSALDLFATAVALAGASAAPGRPLDGVDLIPYLRGEKSGPPHEALFWRTAGGSSFAARIGSRKLVEPRPGMLELYDLVRDRAETNDLAPAQADAVRQLARLKNAWNAQLVAPIFAGPAEARPGNAAAKKAAR